jgi:hypothetical protein
MTMMMYMAPEIIGHQAIRFETNISDPFGEGDCFINENAPGQSGHTQDKQGWENGNQGQSEGSQEQNGWCNGNDGKNGQEHGNNLNTPSSNLLGDSGGFDWNDDGENNEDGTNGDNSSTENSTTSGSENSTDSVTTSSSDNSTDTSTTSSSDNSTDTSTTSSEDSSSDTNEENN